MRVFHCRSSVHGCPSPCLASTSPRPTPGPTALLQLFGWELVMTFVLVSVVYAVAISKPGHGNIGPLAVVRGAEPGWGDACDWSAAAHDAATNIAMRGFAIAVVWYCLEACSSPASPFQGYTLFASAFIGGPLTGAALNPARVLGPALIYNCYW